MHLCFKMVSSVFQECFIRALRVLDPYFAIKSLYMSKSTWIVMLLAFVQHP